MFAVRNRWVAAVLAPLALVVGESAAQAAEPWDLNPNAHRSQDRFGRVVQDACPPGEGGARCFLHWIVQPYVNVTAGSGALGADGIVAAYGLSSSIPPSGGAIVATVLAYDNNTALTDVNAYRTAYGLPTMTACTTTLPAPGQSPPCLAVINQNGASSPLPSVDPGWASESSLDIEMISAACPDCNIVIVEANDNGSNLDVAVNQAAMIPGVVAINNSYGGAEGAGDGANTAYTHPGILVVASGGDADYASEGQNSPTPSPIAPSYPASDSHVLSVGGTTLKLLGTGTRPYTEQVWNEGLTPGQQYSATGTGSGCSTQFAQPAWQKSVTQGLCSMRVSNDVAAAGDYINGLGSRTGIALYCTACLGGTTGGHFTAVFGTSASGPMVAGIFARLKLATTIANDPGWVYRNAQSFHDVTVGSNDSASTDCGNILCTADCGWDGPTGVGSPSAADLLNAEADAGTSPNASCTPSCPNGKCGTGSSSGSSSGAGSGSGSGSGSGGGSSSGSSSGSVGDDSGSGSDASIPPGDDASADAAVEGGSGDGGANNATGKSSGCGCYAVSSDSAANSALFVLSAAGLILVARRRKQR